MKLLTAFLETIVLVSVSMAASLESPLTSMRDTAVAVGDVAPNFTLEDQNGHKVILSDARGHSPVVVVFYRGSW